MPLYNPASTAASLTVEEEDGNPSVAGVTKIQVPSGTLTNDSGTIVSMGYAAAGSSGIQGTIGDAKGDLIAFTAADTPDRIAVGSNGGLLMAASGESTGLLWTQPSWLSKFLGKTDSTHFYWDGNDLAGFTEQKPTGNSTWVEGLGLVSALMDTQTSNDAVAQLIAQTISTGDAWEVGVNVGAIGSDSGGDTTGNRGFGIIMSDGTATTSNCVGIHVQVDNTTGSVVLVGRHGTLTNIATSPWVSVAQGSVMGGWLFIKLKYSASNTFQGYFSNSFGVQYSVFEEADISVTMTPTHVGIMGWNHATGPANFCFSPLLKV